MTDSIISIITYAVLALICYGVAYLINVEPHVVVSYAALALAVDALTRVD
jgi:hypothetical protein